MSPVEAEGKEANRRGGRMKTGGCRAARVSHDRADRGRRAPQWRGGLRGRNLRGRHLLLGMAGMPEPGGCLHSHPYRCTGTRGAPFLLNRFAGVGAGSRATALAPHPPWWPGMPVGTGTSDGVPLGQSPTALVSARAPQRSPSSLHRSSRDPGTQGTPTHSPQPVLLRSPGPTRCHYVHSPPAPHSWAAPRAPQDPSRGAAVGTHVWAVHKPPAPALPHRHRFARWWPRTRVMRRGTM